MFNFTSGATSGAERAASEGGGSSLAPVVAETFLYAGAQNPTVQLKQWLRQSVGGGGEVSVNQYPKKNFIFFLFSVPYPRNTGIFLNN